MRGLSHIARFVSVALIASGGVVATAESQPLGAFSWQLQPYCNVVTFNITQVDATYRLEGFDDQCGAATRASVVGTAFLNPNGTIGLGFNIVATPGGAPVHVDATVTLPGLTGAWSDSAGGAGTFAFGPPVGGLPPRPVGATGPSVMTIVPGQGLVGGGSASTVNVGVSFEGSGAATTVARSDHTHGIATRNTVIGDGALASNATGTDNTALGFNALAASTTANGNVAVGVQALFSINVPGGGGNVAVGNGAMLLSTSACCNVALGSSTLQQNTSGNGNVALGQFALISLDGGFGNVAVGRSALASLSGGEDRNIALGNEAGINVDGGSDNILIGNPGIAADNFAIRIGENQTRTFIAGIHGGTVNAGTGVGVLVDSTGRLGTVASSARFKTNVDDIGPESQAWLHRLRPVSFQYRPEQDRGGQRQFGLIAEEVAEVLPELVVADAEGRPYTVRYHLLPPLLLADVQRLERERRAQDERIVEQGRQLDAQAARLDAQAGELAALRALLDATHPRR